jgi:hypothetical protein
MSAPSTDVIRRVFSEDGRSFVEVGPWADDVTAAIELRTLPGKDSAEYYGPVNIAMSREMAAELGRALIAASEQA